MRNFQDQPRFKHPDDEKETQVVCSECEDDLWVEGYDETETYLCSNCEDKVEGDTHRP